MTRLLTISVLASLVILRPLCAAGPASTNAPAGHDYPSFRIISDRNIFNANRTARSRGGGHDDAKPSKTDTITLVGIMTYDKGPYAFFDGTTSDFKKVLEPGKSIAGYKIVQITPDAVRLESGTNTFDLHVTMKLRREDEGEWKLVPGSGPELGSSASTSSAASDTSSGEESDVLKRLMQQREQELK